MLGKNNRQIDVFSSMMYEKLIPKNHLLVLIDEVVDFSFLYEKLKDRYSDKGRKSKDPVMMTKICLLEYLYNLSDPEIAMRIKTDVAFRWFLGLGIDDEVPDDTTISHFRVNRVGEEGFEEFFNEIVQICINKSLIRSNRYIVDTTDVAANTSYPSVKKLVCDAFRKVIKEIEKFDEALAKKHLDAFEGAIDLEHEKDEKVSHKTYCQIAQKHSQEIYVQTYDMLHSNDKYAHAFGILQDVIDSYTQEKKDRIISVVDEDARLACKSPGNIKRGYKNHIIVDEDSEIILASSQTPFNVGDEKKLVELVEKTKSNFNLKPKEITADKVYGTIDNRAYLKDEAITTNIDFYNEPNKENMFFVISDFDIANDLKSVTCPNNISTENAKIITDEKTKKVFKVFKFDKQTCILCPLAPNCIKRNKHNKFTSGRILKVPVRYDGVLRDLVRAQTEEFKHALNKRCKVERRFATMVRNHGLRRSRYLKIKGAKLHITLSNIACNIVRMVNLLFPPSIAIAKA